jgi:hypothetical protein
VWSLELALPHLPRVFARWGSVLFPALARSDSHAVLLETKAVGFHAWRLRSMQDSVSATS